VATDYPNLSTSELFDGFTVPELLARWWSPAAEIEPYVGGAYHLAWNQMNWHLRGSYTEFVPGERLAFTWHWDHEPDKPARLVEIDFIPGDFGASLKLTHSVYAPDDTAERQEHLEGWLYFLEQLEKIK
jgi:uncharacterized protein YndB with AHSA1/START domain